ncbi:MAG: TPM domain-containing protein [bacterium]
MKNLAKNFLSKEEENEIIESVKKVEQVTSGEIMPMIVSASDHYSAADFIGSISLALFLSIIIMLFKGSENMWIFLAIFGVSFIILYEIIKRVPALKRLFISANDMEKAVEETALTSFYRKGLGNTRDHTGILIFISVFEKKVWVLADKGINEKVKPSAWKEVIELVTKGIKEGKQGEAICKAIGQCKDILKDSFPVRADDIDELANLVVEGEVDSLN